MCLNAIAGYKADKAQAAAKVVMAGKAEITAQQVLGINGSGGNCMKNKPALLEHRGAFKFKRAGKRVYNPYFLVKVVGEEGKECIVLVEVPSQLNGILGEFVGKEFSIADNYGHVPYGALLRAIKGQYEQDHAVERGLEENRANDDGKGTKVPEEVPATA
jgi:hypothetical protein